MLIVHCTAAVKIPHTTVVDCGCLCQLKLEIATHDLKDDDLRCEAIKRGVLIVPKCIRAKTRRLRMMQQRQSRPQSLHPRPWRLCQSPAQQNSCAKPPPVALLRLSRYTPNHLVAKLCTRLAAWYVSLSRPPVDKPAAWIYAPSSAFGGV